MKRDVLMLVALLSLPTPALAQKEEMRPPPPAPATQRADPHGAGVRPRVTGQIALGEMAPDFELDGSQGKPVRLSSLRGEWVALLFMDRRERLVAHAETAEGLTPLNVKLIAVCHDNARPLEILAERQKLPYLALADPTGDISGLYGLFDDEHSATRPGLVLIDRRGEVRFLALGQELQSGDLVRFVQFATQGF